MSSRGNVLHSSFNIAYDSIHMQWRRNEFESGGGGTDPAQSAGKKKFLVVPPPLFGSKRTINRFGERFRDGQYSLVSFLLAVLLLTVPPCPAICKSGAGARAPVSHGVGATVHSRHKV